MEKPKTRSGSLPRSLPRPQNGNDTSVRNIPIRPFVQTPRLPDNREQQKPSTDESNSRDRGINEILKKHSSILDGYLRNVFLDLVNQIGKIPTSENLKSNRRHCQEKVESTLAKQMEKFRKSMVEPAMHDASKRLRLNDNHDVVGNAQVSPIQLPRPGLGSNLSPRNRPESTQFGVSSTNLEIQNLFEILKSLPPMDKYGPMSGKCERETEQMENFLQKSFGFENIPQKYIVHGVKSFKLSKPVERLPSDTIIQFPYEDADIDHSFMMSTDEILRWQQSYRVYADKNEAAISKEFLALALEAKSRFGPEAFLMKFVVRISQCPILMEFDGQIIHRTLTESWPNNIKLVSVTGIDFAGRIHDVDDIRNYVANWQDVYEIDPRSRLPYAYNGRDFRRRENGPRGQLNESLLRQDLKRMARLRLRACDIEQTQVVVETGIGLGVFAGENIGIDETVRFLSALAIREVLEEDGKTYKYIKAVVFALPIFESATRHGRRDDNFHAFQRVFSKIEYQSPIPVLIIDQDMHRLTVAIARRGFRVSELNPADSHGVFGEYWQNHGPAVEEKVALTTVGLLVQHHLINQHVLNPRNYVFL